MRRVRSSAALVLTLALAGCGGGSISGLSVLSGDQDAAQTFATIAPPPPPEPRDPSRGKSLSMMIAQKAEASPKPSGGLFGGLVSPLPAISLTKAGLYAPSSVQSDMSPIAAYAAVALGVKKCWLAYAKPRLPNHNFDGEASLDNGGQAKIAIYEKVEGQKLGRFAFRVDLKAAGNGALVESVNLRLSDQDSERLQADVARWSRGQEGCS
ncbi:MAG: hypothetical protein SGJ17_02360 [Hyphomicrobiales bacterium]|nr:hypothetical protein [Hyphomicrobiales bacterium]